MKNILNKCALVTGCSGFIGSNLVRKLLSSNYRVIGIDNFSNSSIVNIKEFMNNQHFTFVKGDIRDIKLLDENMKDVDIVFHQAALINIAESVEDPIHYNSVNVEGTLNVLWSSYHHNVEKIVFASSAAVYGESKNLPSSESDELRPITPYGLQKKIGEEYCQQFHELFGLNHVILRYFNAYGPGQDPSLPYIGVISKFISRVLSGEDIVIYGDGEQTRDYVHIEDVINANMLAASNPSVNNTAFNVASGEYINLNQLCELIIKECNAKDITLEHAEREKWEVLNHQADITKAEKKLKFRPKYFLEEGLQNTVQWHLSTRKGARKE